MLDVERKHHPVVVTASGRRCCLGRTALTDIPTGFTVTGTYNSVPIARLWLAAKSQEFD
jgi:hypothetical protein